MAVKGVAHIGNLHYVNTNDFQIDVNYVGLHTSQIEAGLSVQVNKDDTDAQMLIAVVADVKSALVTAGMTVGIGDTVKVFGLVTGAL